MVADSFAGKRVLHFPVFRGQVIENANSARDRGSPSSGLRAEDKFIGAMGPWLRQASRRRCMPHRMYITRVNSFERLGDPILFFNF